MFFGYGMMHMIASVSRHNFIACIIRVFGSSQGDLFVLFQDITLEMLPAKMV